MTRGILSRAHFKDIKFNRNMEFGRQIPTAADECFRILFNMPAGARTCVYSQSPA